MDELFLVGRFDMDGRFLSYVATGRGGGVACFTELSSAKRCMAQMKCRSYTYAILSTSDATIWEG